MSEKPTKWQAQQIAQALGSHEIYVSHKVLVFTDELTAVEVTYRCDHPEYQGGVFNEVHDTETLIGGGRAHPIVDAPASDYTSVSDLLDAAQGGQLSA